MYGENRVIRKVLLSEEDNFLLYTKVADKMDQPMSKQALVDPFFYYSLKNPLE